MPSGIGFCLTPDDERILREAGRPGETTTQTLRRALRLLDHDRWMLVDQIRSIDTDHLVGDPVDFLNREELAEVELTLAHDLGIQDAGPRQH